jgi:nitric oxide synthase oxygenase domain/subunit
MWLENFAQTNLEHMDKYNNTGKLSACITSPCNARKDFDRLKQLMFYAAVEQWCGPFAASQYTRSAEPDGAWDPQSRIFFWMLTGTQSIKKFL